MSELCRGVGLLETVILEQVQEVGRSKIHEDMLQVEQHSKPEPTFQIPPLETTALK